MLGADGDRLAEAEGVGFEAPALAGIPLRLVAATMTGVRRPQPARDLLVERS
jgi:hypothetical protein